MFLLTISFASVVASSGQLSVVSGSNYQVNYNAKDSAIQGIQANKDSLSLELSVQATSPVASVELTLPRDLIDAKKSDGSDEMFIVLVDGVFATYSETSNTPQTRTILIQLSSENKDIEIIGTSIGTGAPVPQNNATQTSTVPQKPTEPQKTQNQTQTPTSQPIPTTQNESQNTVLSPDILQQFTSILNFDSSHLPFNLDEKQLVAYSIISAIVIVIIVVIASSVKNSQRKIRK